MDEIITALSVLAGQLREGADRSLRAGPSPFTHVLPSIDQKMNRAELLYAIGFACAETASELRRRKGSSPVFDFTQSEDANMLHGGTDDRAKGS